ncbi:MAG: PQQ-dependent sugar dehydrogenase [Gemmatimonadetes bacterium]|nr:PQQ-dependent sugar dehydrogenase [Gemmatimonadota bacterium]
MRAILFGLLLIGSAGGAFVLGVMVHKYRVQIRGKLSSMQSGGILSTNLYNVSVQKVSVPAEGRDGGIAALRDGVLLVNRKGAAWFVDKDRVLHPSPVVVPVNVAALLEDPDNAGLIHPEQFGVKDIYIEERGDAVRLFASFTFWFPESNCYTLRVALLETTVAALQGAAGAIEGAGGGDWRTLFDSKPCMPLTQLPGGGSPHPTLGAGGRVSLHGPTELLVSIGGFRGENEMVPAAEYWSPENSYGKVIAIDLNTGASRPFTVGHRNPQGLFVSEGGTVWETEHAARGGDELNLLAEGQNYGYPSVSYGTTYDAMIWASNPAQGRHEGFARPSYVWMPSVGISQVLVLQKGGFPYWQGDVIVASMAMEHLYRVRLEDGRAIYAEPMRLDHRARDLIETNRGEIVVKTDDDFLIYLTNVTTGSAAAAALPPVERGQLLATTCMGCHTLTAGGANGIGPNLHRIVGRDIGSSPGYPYSAALQRAPGAWTDDALAKYIANPAAAVPGTTMPALPAYTDQELADLLTYLKSLR